MNQPGVVENNTLDPISLSHLVELSVVVPAGQEQIGEDMKNFWTAETVSFQNTGTNCRHNCVSYSKVIYMYTVVHHTVKLYTYAMFYGKFIYVDIVLQQRLTNPATKVP